MYTFTWDNHSFLLEKPLAEVKSSGKPLQLKYDDKIVFVIIRRWLPFDPPRPISIEAVGADVSVTEFLETQLLGKQEVVQPKPLGAGGPHQSVEINGTTYKVLKRGLFLNEIQARRTTDKMLSELLLIKLDDLMCYTRGGFQDYVHSLVTASAVKYGITDVSYKILNHIPAGLQIGIDKYPEGGVVLQVTFSCGEMP